jgi:hypothetical protein
MFQVWGTGGRRVLGLALASLVPAAAVTLLLVNQPSIADQQVFPLLRVPLAVLALGLALAAVVSWVVAGDRLSRPALTGLAIVGVTTLLCIGPLTESSANSRLYAFDLATRRQAWGPRTTAASDPRICGADLAVTNPHTGQVTVLDPASGEERTELGTSDDPATRCPVAGDERLAEEPPISFPGERVVTWARFGHRTYVYVATDGADGPVAGAIAAIDGHGHVLWRRDLPAAVVADHPVMDANADVVVVAGGERLLVFPLAPGVDPWTVSVVTLGKSRRYALPGAVQQVVLDDSRLFLSLAPE